jgi:hypothetical protein
MTTPAPPRGPADPDFIRASGLQQAGDFAGAAAVWRRMADRALTLNIALNLGICRSETGDFADARRWLDIAARHRPNEPEVRRARGVLFGEMGRTAEAEAEFRAGLAADPRNERLRLAFGALLLSVGRYAEGWPLLEARMAVAPDVVPPIAVSFPEWKGEPLAGRSILIWYEQGFGDQIQFVRFARSLKAAGAGHVAVGCRPALVELFRAAAGVDEVIPVAQGGQVVIRPYDLWSRYFSVPGHLGVTEASLSPEPYLAAPADRRARWTGWSGVGLVWRASPTGFNARNKNVPDGLAQRLLDMGAKSLHPEDTGAADFADTAAIVEQLDLVISIDTSVAHLAGALGKPCWTLLPRLHTDWRWLRDRTESPWYPSMRLYRQARPLDWTGVIEAVARDLQGVI